MGKVRGEDTTPTDERASLRRLILGQLSGEERDRLEARVLAEAELLAQASEVEAALADAHALGRLSPEDRAAWEARLRVSPRLRERDGFARALAAVAMRTPTRRLDRGHLRLALAAGLLLALAGAVWLARAPGSARPAGQVAQDAVPSPRDPETHPSPDATRAEPRPTIPGPPALVTLALGVGTVRGSQTTPRVVLPSGVVGVRLQAELESASGYRCLRAVVETDGGARVFQRDGLRPPAQTGDAVLEVTVPAAALPNGAYVVTIEACTPDGAWEALLVRDFRVQRSTAIRPPG